MQLTQQKVWGCSHVEGLHKVTDVSDSHSGYVPMPRMLSCVPS